METTLCKRAIQVMAVCILIVLGSCQPPKVEKPEKTIDKKQATMLSTRFIKELTELMEETKDTSGLYRMKQAGIAPAAKAEFQLTSHTYYTVEELEHYFAWVKQEAREKGYTLEGYRFYFGIYPDNDKYGEKRNFMTMFISPAGRKAERQEGAMVKLPPVFYNTQNISEIESYNFGGAGDPPKATYE